VPLARPASLGLMALPIVMNPASQIRPELAVFGIRTPTSSTPTACGEYPSMYLSTAGLIHQVQAHVRS
jgi:hypothetical protein